MASDNEPGETPWYRTTAATVAAGGIGAVLLLGLVLAVVRMSDEWSKPTTTVLTTTVPSAAPSSTRESQPFIITPSTTSDTFTTSVPVSTTEIPGPSGTPTTSDTTSTQTTPTTPTSRELPTTFPSQRRPSDSDQPTTRNRPRYNETRTYQPG